MCSAHSCTTLFVQTLYRVTGLVVFEVVKGWVLRALEETVSLRRAGQLMVYCRGSLGALPAIGQLSVLVRNYPDINIAAPLSPYFLLTPVTRHLL